MLDSRSEGHRFDAPRELFRQTLRHLLPQAGGIHRATQAEGDKIAESLLLGGEFGLGHLNEGARPEDIADFFDHGHNGQVMHAAYVIAEIALPIGTWLPISRKRYGGLRMLALDKQVDGDVVLAVGMEDAFVFLLPGLGVSDGLTERLRVYRAALADRFMHITPVPGPLLRRPICASAPIRKLPLNSGDFVACGLQRVPGAIGEASFLRKLKEFSAMAIGGGDNPQLQVAPRDAAKGSGPNLAILLMESKLVEDHVAGVAARRVRVGRQGDDARAVRKFYLAFPNSCLVKERCPKNAAYNP